MVRFVICYMFCVSHLFGSDSLFHKLGRSQGGLDAATALLAGLGLQESDGIKRPSSPADIEDAVQGRGYVLKPKIPVLSSLRDYDIKAPSSVCVVDSEKLCGCKVTKKRQCFSKVIVSVGQSNIGVLTRLGRYDNVARRKLLLIGGRKPSALGNYKKLRFYWERGPYRFTHTRTTYPRKHWMDICVFLETQGIQFRSFQSRFF